MDNRALAQHACNTSTALSSTLFEKAVDVSLDAIVFSDMDGRITYANPAFVRMWGHESADDVIGRHYSAFASSTEQAGMIVAAIMREGRWSGESFGRRKNGETFLIDMSSVLITDEAGVPCAMMASIADRSDRERAAEALRESEEKYRSLVESALDPVFICNLEGRYLFANAAASRMLGRPPGYVIGKTVDDLFPPAIAAEYHKGVSQVIGSGESLIAEHRVEIEGREVWFNTVLQPIRDADGGITKAQGMVRDITRLKAAELALRANEERLRQAVGTSKIGIFDHDHLTDVMYFSPEQREILGWDEPVSGKDVHATPGSRTFMDLIHPDDRARVVSEVDRAHRSGNGIFDVEYRILRSDGSLRWITTRSQTFFENEGEARRPVRTVGASRDITDQKTAEAERARLQQELIQATKMESIGRLAGGVAHDFNNMLNVIMGHVEFALDQIDSAHPVAADLTEVRHAAQRSADLTRQLLAFARRQAVAPRIIDLNDYVDRMLTMLRRLIGENVTLTWNPGDDVSAVEIDPTQVDQILANLTANARDAIAGVGQVTIRTANVSFDAAYCREHPALRPGAWVLLELADSGRGMDQETLDHIFEPFYTTKAEGQGTGLGLATVYGIVEQNRGFISASSRLGGGTTVRIFLPRASTQSEAAAASSAKKRTGGRETLLVVEDEPMLLRVTQAILQKLGYTVLAAGTPSQAVKFVEEQGDAIRLVVSDVVMPEMNGPDLVNRLLGIAPHLKCLFVSGYFTSAILPDGVVRSGAQFLQKPFAADDLAAKVRGLLGVESAA
jgi:two-component system, cell cycle sensor histidine kinase and response regulator CckA